ncbi:hypothetical protein T4B_5274 [Trichinella pseudospiralis]|uniref:Uncharacterized protein n=1 Tax=Trichinella pseudospiralis TaxID=6337 RepID=A0A0V1JV03_TRIPS|nr:hypothetical protein T4B_5274 [Trichinella pseudospiralis]KRZ38816.1 hypothetical protein T4C_12942 [Trichinella pseudospiralis]
MIFLFNPTVLTFQNGASVFKKNTIRIQKVIFNVSAIICFFTETYSVIQAPAYAIRVLYFNIFIVVYVDLMQLHGTYSILLASENKLSSLFNCGNDSLTSIIREIS